MPSTSSRSSIEENTEMPDTTTCTHALLITGSRTWNDELGMREAFREIWRAWGPQAVARPLLISGAAARGADAMAEHLWRAEGFSVRTFPADWSTGLSAGFDRNQLMVDALCELRDTGVLVHVAAFLDLCVKSGCRQARREQLLPDCPGHFSHGTVHLRERALVERLPLLDAFPR
jgi:hypothetical protein